MMRHLVVLTTIAWLGISVGHTAPSGWAINATAIEACSCPHFCMCYFNPHPAAHHDHGKMEDYCRFNIAYRVNNGTGFRDYSCNEQGLDRTIRTNA
jgi:hypothetical protein